MQSEIIARLKAAIADAEADMENDYADAATTGERVDLYDYGVSISLKDAKELEAALSTDAEPVRYQRQLDTGRWVEVDEEDISHARIKGQPVRALYDRPQQPAPSVAVKELHWDEDGDNLKARMGDREWMLNITSDGKTWAGSTRPFVFGYNGNWSSVPNCSFLSLDNAKAACQADCQSRYAALSAQVQDVAEYERREQVCKDAALSQWERSLKRPDLTEKDRVIGAVEAYKRQAFAFTMLAAAPAAKQGEEE